MSRRQETSRSNERRRVVSRREGGREGEELVFSCSSKIARQQRLRSSCRSACNTIYRNSTR